MCKNFRNFLHHELCMKKSAKIHKCIFYWKKNPDFLKKFPMISLAKKRKKRKWWNPSLLNQNGELWSENLAKSPLAKPLPYTQVRIDRRSTVGPTLLKLVQPCWPVVGPTSEMITLSVHWHEQLARRRVPEMGRLRQNMLVPV